MGPSTHDATVTRPPHLAAGGSLPRPGELLAGRFLLERELGHGGAGVVFAATDRSIGQRVAVKVVHPALVDERTRERLRREVSASRPAHANAVTVYELYEDGGLLFLAMELVEGGSLRDRLREEGRLPVGTTVAVGRQVAAALAHLHRRGVVHRDVKPGNILLEPDGTARLCDTGLARPLAEGATITESQMVVGTPAYMAPEQATARELTAASDVYGLGLTLFTCLTGKVPLEGDTAVATLVRRQRSRPPRLRGTCLDCPRWLERLIRRMLEPLPRDRPSAAEVERMLASGRVWPRPRRRHLVAAGLLLALAVATPLGYRALRRESTVRVEVVDGQVRGVDEAARVTWSHPVSGEVFKTERADLDGDGLDEVVVATRPGARRVIARDEPVTPEILAVARSGRVVTRMRPDTAVTEWWFPYPKRLQPHFELHDLDGDGLTEIVAPCHVLHLYPTVLMVWWGSERRWENVLAHPGRLYDVAPLPGEAGPGLAFLGVNNELGMLPVVGRLRLLPPGRRAGGEVFAPTARVSPGSVPNNLAYLLLDESLLYSGQGETSVDVGKDSSVHVTWYGRKLEVDPLGNPVPGPNAGSDLRQARARFFALLSKLEPSTRLADSDQVREVLSAAGQELGPLLDEAPYRAVLDAQGANALARAGDPAAGVRLLDDTLRLAPYDDLASLRAHLLATSGDLPGATAAVRALTAAPRTQRARFDGVVLRLRLAVETHDVEDLARCVDLLSRASMEPSRRAEVSTAIAARAHLWWDEVGEADCGAVSLSYEPAGEALAALARWRLGRPDRADLDAMPELEREQPDAAAEATLAAAATHLGLADPRAALAVLDPLVATLAPEARVDFFARQHLDLAHGLRAKALLAAGQPHEAAAAAGELLRTATPGLLPAILAREVLDSTSDRGPLH